MDYPFPRLLLLSFPVFFFPLLQAGGCSSATAVLMVRQITGVAECVGYWLRGEDQGLPAARRSVLSREAQHGSFPQYCFRCDVPSETAPFQPV